MPHDLFCKNPQCQEPWDSYGVHTHTDMTKEEAELFLEGEGCPSCHFGIHQATGPLGLLAQAVQKRKLEEAARIMRDLTDGLNVFLFLENMCDAQVVGENACGHCFAVKAQQQAKQWLSEIGERE